MKVAFCGSLKNVLTFKHFVSVKLHIADVRLILIALVKKKKKIQKVTLNAALYMYVYIVGCLHPR